MNQAIEYPLDKENYYILDFLQGELDSLEEEPPEFGPCYNIEEFNEWSTRKWIIEQILNDIECNNSDAEEAICDLGNKMLRFSRITRDHDNKLSFYDAFSYCLYLHDMYQEILIKLNGDDF